MNDGEMEIVRRRGMRTGYTTGACAAAAAAAATQALLSGVAPAEVTIHLPVGRDASFALVNWRVEPIRAGCGVIKDAGDDPDVTHGAEIRATVWRGCAPGIELRGGEGVGTVTLPGLGLAIGGPAINPVPRRMICDEVTRAAGDGLKTHGLVVEISVPRGAEIAKKTLNARLGIVGGISILGTTGIVRPYSTASYRASVGQGIDVAAANGQHEVVLSTGGRSEQFVQALLDLPEVCFVEMGEFTGYALKRAVQRRLRRATLAGMIGKFSKIAQGHFMTHVAGNRVDPAFLAALAARAGADSALQAEIAAANTARHAQELAQRHGLSAFFELIAAEAAGRSRDHVHGELAVEAILFDFDGAVLGRAGLPACEARQ
ncbi:MAG TPA: cobalt-precorrin-5B (C(1))-methyltransferase [Dehalococcoidia bacterium]|nr:cobalt-precorrin-5B (C(1))-methyltransferase [Dehalococcoidia bacterium]